MMTNKHALRQSRIMIATTAMRTIGVVALIGAMTWGCSDNGGGHDATDGHSHGPGADHQHDAVDREVVVELQSLGDSGVTGSATFTSRGGQVSLMIEVQNAPPGPHAFHIHEIGDCSAPDGTSAGGHWNPTGKPHGKWGVNEFHLGDVGNITVGEDGTGAYMMRSDLWSIGDGAEGDILGRSVIVHAGVDDFVSQPTGAAGGRIACGVIE